MDAETIFRLRRFRMAPFESLPTDVSGFLQYGQCWRHLRLRLHERTAGAKSFQEFGVPLQQAPKLLTKAGVEFEKEVYADIDRMFERIDFERVKAGGAVNKRTMIGSVRSASNCPPAKPSCLPSRDWKQKLATGRSPVCSTFFASIAMRQAS